jgi:hypothetical protein
MDEQEPLDKTSSKATFAAQEPEKANREYLSKLGFHINVGLDGFGDQKDKAGIHQHICHVDHWHLPWEPQCL